MSTPLAALARVLYTATIGLCAAAAGVMLAFWLCDLAVKHGLLQGKVAYGDDPGITSVGWWPVVGGLVGLVTGTAVGWRALAKGRS